MHDKTSDILSGGSSIPVPANEKADKRHCQSKFYTTFWSLRAGRPSTVFAHESPTRSGGFDAENGLYLFALTMPTGVHVWAATGHRHACSRNQQAQKAA
jgi:hypothetical protein